MLVNVGEKENLGEQKFKGQTKQFEEGTWVSHHDENINDITVLGVPAFHVF